jgi:hypothetical protein
MTQAERNDLIDRATRIAGMPTLEYMIEHAALEEHLVSRVSVADLRSIRDEGPFTIGQRMICGIVSRWNLV